MAMLEATEAFNKVLQDFGYTRKLETYNPLQHQPHPPPQHPLFQNNSTYTLFHSSNTSFS